MQDLLRPVTEKKASDLVHHRSSPPAIKIHGEIRPARASVSLTPEQSGTLVRAIMNDPPDQGIRRLERVQLRHCAARHRPLPCQRIRSAGRRRLCHPPDQRQDPQFRRARLPPIPQGSGAVEARLVILVGGTGSGKSTSLASDGGATATRRLAATSSRSKIPSSTSIPAQGLCHHAP